MNSIQLTKMKEKKVRLQTSLRRCRSNSSASSSFCCCSARSRSNCFCRSFSWSARSDCSYASSCCCLRSCTIFRSNLPNKNLIINFFKNFNHNSSHFSEQNGNSVGKTEKNLPLLSLLRQPNLIIVDDRLQSSDKFRGRTIAALHTAHHDHLVLADAHNHDGRIRACIYRMRYAVSFGRAHVAAPKQHVGIDVVDDFGIGQGITAKAGRLGTLFRVQINGQEP